MAIGKIPRELYSEIANMPPVVPSLFDMLRQLQLDQDECLLAVMAAGVPVGCIEIIPPHKNTSFDFNSTTLSLGFRFTTSSVYY